MEENIRVRNGVSKQMHQYNNRVEFMNSNVEAFPVRRETPLDEITFDCSPKPWLGAIRRKMQIMRIGGPSEIEGTPTVEFIKE